MTSRCVRLASWLALVVVVAGCGKKGPPLAPLRPVPAAAESFTVRRLGDVVRLQFTVPTTNSDGSMPADLSRVEVYGLTIDPTGADPDLDEFMAAGTLVTAIDVRPPLPASGEGAAPDPAPSEPPSDLRSGQGDVVTVEELLTEEARVAVRFGSDTYQPPVGPRTLAALVPTPEARRSYLIVGFSRRDHRSRPTPRRSVPLGSVPAPPTGLAVTYTETDFVLSWTPEGPDPWQPVWPLFKYGRGVEVYEVASDGSAKPERLNTNLITADTYAVPITRVGVSRCFAVRAAESRGTEDWAGPLSPSVCATPVDTFAPAAPTGLIAVPAGDVVSLIWNANAEADLAGYLVLRAEAPSDTLRAVTASPVRETTYRDLDVRTGTRYIYAVVAVDTASPPNISAQSDRVELAVR